MIFLTGIMNDPLALHETYAKNEINLHDHSGKNRLHIVCHRSSESELFAAAYFDSRGGFLSIEGTDVGLFIPPGALKEEQFVYISLSLVEESISGLEEENWTLLSPIVTCGPAGLHFNKKVL